MIATRQIGSADRAVEEHVAEMGEVLGAIEIDDMAGRVAGRVIDFKLVATEGNPVAILQPAVRHDVLKTGNAVLLRLHLDPFQQWPIVLVRTDDFNAERFLQFFRATRVVEMPVRQPDLLDGQAVLLKRFENDRHIAARIDDYALLRVRIKENRAVLLEGCHRNDAGLEHAHDMPRLSLPASDIAGKVIKASRFLAGMALASRLQDAS
ncbi:hypothetical protein AJ87_31530 [Rhizobium yanglingense]|nr:hypothetical protein AJ87_31530 [Rhizobium yanglingense]